MCNLCHPRATALLKLGRKALTIFIDATVYYLIANNLPPAYNGYGYFLLFVSLWHITLHAVDNIEPQFVLKAGYKGLKIVPLLLLLTSYSLLPTHAQCVPGDSGCDLPINQSDVISQPYSMAPYDYQGNGNLSPAVFTLTNQFFSYRMIEGMGKSGLTVWYLIFESDSYNFILGYVILLIALGVFFWFAWWIIERRSRYKMPGYAARVSTAQDNVSNFNSWAASNPYNEEPDLLDQQDPKEWQRAYNSMQRQNAREQKEANRWQKKQEKEWEWAAKHYKKKGK